MPTFVFDDILTTLLVIALLVAGVAVGVFLRERCTKLAVPGVPVLFYAVLTILSVTISTQETPLYGGSIEAAKAMGLESGKNYPVAIGLVDGITTEGSVFSVTNFNNAYTREGKLIINFSDGKTEPTALEFLSEHVRLKQSNTERPSATVTLEDDGSWRGGEGGWYSEYRPVSSNPCKWVVKNLVPTCTRVITRELVLNDTVRKEGLNFIVNHTSTESLASDTRLVLVLPTAQYEQLVTGGNK